jgi:tetratricopeptide (TPR) repeat protein
LRLRFVLAAVCIAVPAQAANEVSARAKVEEAASELVKGNPSQAIAAYTDALGDTSLPNDRRATILTDRAVAYARSGQNKLALEDFNRGSLLLTLGLTREAIKDFDRAITLAPGYAAAYNNRAGARVRLGEHAEAMGDYTKAIELLPQNAAPLSGRGRAHLALGRPHAAMRDFTRAATADARFPTAYRNRAEAHLELGHYAEAIEDLSRAIAFDAGNAELYVLRGHGYLASDNTASALKDFARVLELDPNSAAGYQGRGLAHALAEAFEEAFGDLNRAIELDPKSARAFAYRAYAYRLNGQSDIGLKDVQTALKLDANSAEAHWAKGEIEEAVGRLDQAKADYRRALALKPALRQASLALERLGVGAAEDETAVSGAGLDPWRVVKRAGRYFAVNDEQPRLRVPLEMMGEGQPRLLAWEPKLPPLKGIGSLKFHAGSVQGKTGREEVELAAVLDLASASVLAILPHRQGERTASWTWGEDRVTVASVDGVIDEINLRPAKPKEQPVAQSQRRYAEQPRGPSWAPWQSLGIPGFQESRPSRSPPRQKPKTLFDLLFN